MEDKNKFKVGDVVRMKSGGPWMVVVELRGVSYCRCYWFNMLNKVMEYTLPVECLELRQ